jgi:hypothetical protein
MKRIGIITTLLVAMLLVAPAHAQSPACQGLEVHAAQLTFPTVAIQFSVCDAQGNRMTTLDRSAVRIIEDGTPITSFTLESQTAHDGQPVQTVPLVSGGTFTLVTTGASIGIVFDASQLLNGTGAGAGDHLGAARAAIEAFLLEPGDPPPPRTRSPGNMERVALFIPADQPAQALQPDGLPGFTQDRYAVINTLRQNLPVRQGKTSLNAAIQAAIDATARDAQENGGKAVVLVVSDGGDALTGDSFNSLISQASQKQVKIVAFGIGTDKALQNNGFRLKQLAEATGGIYLERPDANSAGSAFQNAVQSQPAAIYTVRYDTRIIDDGKSHTVVLEVVTPSGTLSYPFPLTANVPSPNITLAPLGDVLLRQYFMFAIPIAVMLSLLLTLMSGVIFWVSSASSGITRGKTRH